jgi:hypothetical protein
MARIRLFERNPLMTVTMSLHFDPNADLDEAIDYLLQLRVDETEAGRAAGLAVDEARASSAADQPDVLTLFAETDPRHRSRRFLEALSAEPELFVDLAEKAVLRNQDGSVLSPASLRAVYRNLTKTENRLLEEGRLKRKVVVYDWTRYAQDGAGRYSLRPADLKALDKHLNR